MGNTGSRTITPVSPYYGPQQSFYVQPNPNKPSLFTYVYIIFIIIFLLGVLGISAVSLYYIEETKNNNQDNNISVGIIQTSEASTSLAIILSVILIIASIVYIYRT
jgi:heme/copper-type cytochrome/quinol oxidase subunit 2